MRTVFFLAIALTAFAGRAWGNEFAGIIEGRISSRESAARCSEELCRAFPDRAGEIVEAIGAEYPKGVMAAALAGVGAAPASSNDIVSAVSKTIPPELLEAAAFIIQSKVTR